MSNPEPFDWRAELVLITKLIDRLHELPGTPEADHWQYGEQAIREELGSRLRRLHEVFVDQADAAIEALYALYVPPMPPPTRPPRLGYHDD